MHRKKSRCGPGPTLKDKESIQLLTRLRNACRRTSEIHDLTRTALDTVRKTRSFKRKKFLSGDVKGHDADREVYYGTWTASFHDGGEVTIFVTTSSDCVARWSFTWPDLLMTSYVLITCTCRPEEKLGRRWVDRLTGKSNPKA